MTETIGVQQRQTSPRFRALRLASGCELETSQRLAVPSTGEHSSIVVILELAVTGRESVSRECSRSLELDIENRPVGLGDRRDPARHAPLVGRQAQRVQRLVVGSAPNLRAGIGADETSSDSHRASRLADATGQHIGSACGRLGGRAVDLRRHDEDVRPVEQQQDLLRERGSELGEVGAATKILERRHDDRRRAVPRRDRRGRRKLRRSAPDVELLQHDDRESSQQNGHHEQCTNPTPPTPVACRLRLTRRHRAQQHGSRRLRGSVAVVVRASREVPASRQIDSHRIVASFVGVVLGQAASQAARLDSHEGIGLRVEIRRPAEHFYRNRVALQPFPLTGQGLLDDEAQEFRGAGRLLETAARENPFEPCA